MFAQSVICFLLTFLHATGITSKYINIAHVDLTINTWSNSEASTDASIITLSYRTQLDAVV